MIADQWHLSIIGDTAVLGLYRYTAESIQTLSGSVLYSPHFFTTKQAQRATLNCKQQQYAGLHKHTGGFLTRRAGCAGMILERKRLPPKLYTAVLVRELCTAPDSQYRHVYKYNDRVQINNNIKTVLNISNKYCHVVIILYANIMTILYYY